MGGISGIGIAPDNSSNTGCASVHRFGLSISHSVNNSINVSGGDAMSPSLSLKYNPQTAVMKFTANLKISTAFISYSILSRNCKKIEIPWRNHWQ